MTATLVCPARAAWGRRRARRKLGYGADPVGQCLGPARLGLGEVGGAHDRDKNPRRTDLAGEPVNDHRHRVAGVIDKQLVAANPMHQNYGAAQQIPPSMAWGSQTIKSASIAPVASDVPDATAAAASHSDNPPLRSSACSKAKCWDVTGCARTR